MHQRMRLGLAAFFLASRCHAALTTVSDWGDNPTGLEMEIYLPTTLAENPAVVLALHGCTETGDIYYGQANYSTYAETEGFIIVYPTAPHDSNCWDVATNATLTHDAGGDSKGLVNMVDYLIETYNADPTKVFATGSSSGCMIVFAAGSCYSGIPAGCLKGSPGSSPFSANQTCAEGKVIQTGEQWAELVHEMYPDYTGEYPRMQTWHGTADYFVNYPNLGEQLKEWSTLLGVEFSSNSTDTPESGYTKMIYGDGTKLVGYSAAGVGHTVPVHPDSDMEWFGII
ncbi:carbohydrate esterase family 1 protein [Xylariaceae sp. FL0016]|nr:carbohydrate esterase family 1 protein [Xylariaceae sp. FL0016]